MKEATRQFYLQSMGVTLWYPRQPLPGAAPSPELDFSEEAPAVEVATVAVPQPRAAVSPASEALGAPAARGLNARSGAPSTVKAPNLSGLMSGDAPKAGPVAPPTPTQVAEKRPTMAPPAQPEMAIAIYCGLWIGRRYAVFADLDGQVSSDLQQRLMHNLLRALDEGKDDGGYPVRFHQVRWPVFANPLIPGNGAEGLKVVLGSLLPESDEHVWIVLGEDAGRVLDRSIAHPRHLWLRDSVRPADMAADGELKRRLWQRIREQLAASP